MTVLRATNASIRAAGDRITDSDKAAIEVLRKLARTIDHPDFPVINGRFDNVTIPTYFKYLDALGLTPAGRKVIEGKAGGSDGDGKPAGGVAKRRAKVSQLRSA